MALTRARVVSGSPAFAARVEEVIRAVLCRPRDAEAVAGDVVEMRRRDRQGEGRRTRAGTSNMPPAAWSTSSSSRNICNSCMPPRQPEILDTSTARVLDKAWRLGVLPAEDADVLRPAVRLHHNLTQILRLCLSGPFDPKTAGAGLLGLLCRAADLPDFATLDAHLRRHSQGARELQPDPGRGA